MIEPKKKDLPVKPSLEDLLKLGEDMFEKGPGKKKTKKKKKTRKKSAVSKKVRSQKIKSNRIESSSKSVVSIYKRKKPKFISK